MSKLSVLEYRIEGRIQQVKDNPFPVLGEIDIFAFGTD